MPTASLNVAHVGPHASVQDAGRPGLMRFGVPQSGPMDRRSYAIANAAIGNPPGATVIEISLGGLVLDCTEGTVSFAVAGGGFQVSVGAVLHAQWTVATLRSGQRLSIRAGDWGSWSYLAFAGDLRAGRWLGSAATHSISGFGGGALRSGGKFAIDQAEARSDREGDITLPDWAQPIDTVRVVLGPQERFFDAATLATFLAAPFTLTDAYDRMGVRLSGPALPVNAALDMPSEPILRGSVQVAGDGVATVLLADHQTTGGYPKIATVLGTDLNRFAQLRSGAKVKFVAVTAEKAIAIARGAAQDLDRDLARAATPSGSLAQRLFAMNLIGGVVSGTES